VLPLDVCGLEVVLGRGEIGAEQVDEGIALLDVLTQLGADPLDERVESGSDLAELSVLGS